jgi:hypothetical protein
MRATVIGNKYEIYDYNLYRRVAITRITNHAQVYCNRGNYKDFKNFYRSVISNCDFSVVTNLPPEIPSEIPEL